MSIQVKLPANTRVFIRAIANAAWLQRVTITPPSGSPIVWKGSGEGNQPFGDIQVTTSGKIDTYTVNIEHSSDGGNSWNSSSSTSGDTSIASLRAKYILSEDGADSDYNDAVVEFMWWIPLS